MKSESYDSKGEGATGAGSATIQDLQKIRLIYILMLCTYMYIVY